MTDKISPELIEAKLAYINEVANGYTSETRSIFYDTERGLTKCRYNNPTGACGCAIGRRIPDVALRIALDGMETPFMGTGVSNPDVFEKLPADLKIFGEAFLFKLQGLHDNPHNWNEWGISSLGQEAAQELADDVRSGII